MAKVLLFLAVVIVILNGMTFLLVVNQGSGPEKSATAGGAQPGARTTTGGPDVHAQKLETLIQNVQTVSKSLGDLSRKVDDLQRKVSLASTRTLPAPAPVTAGTAAAATALSPSSGNGSLTRPSRPPPAAVRNGPTEISRVPGGRPTTGAATREESDEETEEAPAASSPKGNTAPPQGNGAGTETTPDAATGQPATPADGTAGETPNGDAGAEKHPEQPGQ
jgi:hypothetical protein